jgi:4-amino-4-deoxy-L-arabinose transferase-like glycosyltransferase
MQNPMRPRWPTTIPVVPLFVLLIVAAMLRSGAIIAQWERLYADPDAYRLIAENLAQRGVLSRTMGAGPATPTAFRPPLYPLLLALTAWHGQVTPTVVAGVHILTGSLTVVLVWILGQRWGLGRLSFLAAALVAADPILLHQSGEVMTETVATLLGVLGLLALTQWGFRFTYLAGMLAGAVLGLAVLCRPTFLIWAVLCGTYVIVVQRSCSGVKQVAVFGAALCAVLLPWGIRNQWTFGRPIITTTHGGYTLLLANNPYFYEHLRTGTWGSVWDARELRQMVSSDTGGDPATPAQDQTEIEADRRLYELAQRTIRQQPGTFLYASLVRVGYLWSPLAHRVDPHESRWVMWMRWGAAVWYIAVLALAVVGAVRLRGTLLTSPWVWGALCVLALTLVHTVYWTNMRMRAPLMPIVGLLAAAACCRRPPAGRRPPAASRLLL